MVPPSGRHWNNGSEFIENKSSYLAEQIDSKKQKFVPDGAKFVPRGAKFVPRGAKFVPDGADDIQEG